MTQVDTGEFAEFYSANFHRIAGQLSAYLGDHAEAQDLTQEAFCRALDRWNSISGYSDAAAWVRRVAWNLATSRLRHLQVAWRHVRGERLQHVEGPGPERIVLTQALKSLPPNHRLAVVLHHLGHLSTAEIAEQQGVAEGTVRSWLSRGRSQLAEYFVEKQAPDWQKATGEAIRPPGVAKAVQGVRRRRATRRAGIAAMVALVVAIPLLVALGRESKNPPVIGPTAPPVSPSPSASASGAPAPALNASPRGYVAHGTQFVETPTLHIVDRNNIFALFQTCQSTVNLALICVHALDYTHDQGQSWESITLPDVGQSSFNLYVLDGQTITVHTQKPPKRFFLTKDRGQTWTSHANVPPAEALRVNLGEYYLLCPGAEEFEDGKEGSDCQDAKLHKAGSGQVDTSLPLRGRKARIINGRDGRLWLVDSSRRLYFSVDAARTWVEQKLPEGGADPQDMKLSPDGKEVWVQATEQMYQLSDGTWHGHPVQRIESLMSWAPVGDGMLVLIRPRSAVFYQRGTETPIAVEQPTGVSVHADGTLSIRSSSSGLALGFGTGKERQWVVFEP